MIQVDILKQDVNAANWDRFNHPSPIVQQRMEVLWLKAHELPHNQIATLADVSPNSVTKYLQMYKEGGVEELRKLNYYRPQSELDDHRSTLEDYFRKNPVGSIKEAASIIKDLTGVERGETQVKKFLKSIGVKRRKVGSIPSKADPDKQKEFIDEKLQPAIDEAKSGKRKLFFVDAAHFVLAPFLGYLWSLARVLIKAPAGRKRFNVLGAIDAITHDLFTVTNTTYINAESFCQLLNDLRNHYVDIPITLVLDNARYQKCAFVFECAKKLDIELLYLPAYSPNLNIIERLWKFVKKKCLYSKYYEDFDLFKKSITDCLSKTGSEYKEELDSLLTLKFQTFKKEQIAEAR